MPQRHWLGQLMDRCADSVITDDTDVVNSQAFLWPRFRTSNRDYAMTWTAIMCPCWRGPPVKEKPSGLSMYTRSVGTIRDNLMGSQPRLPAAVAVAAKPFSLRKER